jgi:AcrR family transcriptional regulator
MPVLTEETRARRRRRVVDSALACFSRNGFHATSMDDVIAATGMSSSAVYRYFRSKDEIIAATTDEGLARVRGIFEALLAHEPRPEPGETLTVLVAELDSRTINPDYDMTRIAVQTWAEALRNPILNTRVRALYLEVQELITELARDWRDSGELPEGADVEAVAKTLFSLMHGLIIMHHVVSDVPADALRSGLSLLGAAVGTSTSTGTSTPESNS